MTHPSGTSNTSYSYDVADQNTQASSSINCSGTAGTLTQSFSGSTGFRNVDGQVTQDEEAYAGSCGSLPSNQRNYSYDLAGRVTYQGTSPQGTNPNNISYDSSGDPTEISSHDANGNFDTYTQAFDNAGEITGQTPVAGSQGAASTYSENSNRRPDVVGDWLGNDELCV